MEEVEALRAQVQTQQATIDRLTQDGGALRHQLVMAMATLHGLAGWLRAAGEPTKAAEATSAAIAALEATR